MLQRDALAEHVALVSTLGWEDRGLARKRRLYLAALCRHFWDEIPIPSGKTAVDRAVEFADGQATASALAAAHQAHLQAHTAYVTARGKRVMRTRAAYISGCALSAAEPTGRRWTPPLHPDVARAGTHLLHDIYGSPGADTSESTPWLTTEAVEMARAIYDTEAFERLPLLAEALAAAGCADAEILSHCHAPGPHVRGCWVVDLVLGKA